MLRDKCRALATRWARSVSKDSRPLLWSGLLAANGLAFLGISALPAISSLGLGMIGLYALGTAMLLFERAGFIELMRQAGADDEVSVQTDPDRPATSSLTPGSR